MTIGLHNLKRAHGSRHRIKRLGRGNAGKGGTTAGRGTKGQKSRSGVSGLKRLGMKRQTLALPKLGGFRSLKIRAADFTLADLTHAFPNGGTVTLQALRDHELIPGSAEKAKVIGVETLKKSFQLKGIAASAGNWLRAAGNNPCRLKR